ncbi:hypothetical protein [Saccharibacillus sp. JS10]|uniref:hypothetical protein n=1 Tax=Saccharibacillus sp. JS10 TaxID=2950552 RepID=UPI00210B863C|nr:hypothetical protein [Saccharibacillus sp. JS10]MCQ4086207.1 hypothetical protein [Saccharibacillus sp. JS10]
MKKRSMAGLFSAALLVSAIAPFSASAASLPTDVGKLSLGAPTSSVDIQLILAQLAVSTKEASTGNEKAKIKISQEAIKAEMKEKQAKIEEATKKIQEAEAKKASSSQSDAAKQQLIEEYKAAHQAIEQAQQQIAAPSKAPTDGTPSKIQRVTGS